MILSPKEITDLNHGAAIRIYGIAKALTLLNNEVIIICIPRFRGGFFRKKVQEKGLTIISASLLEALSSLNLFLKTLLTASIIQIEFPIFSPLIPILRLLGKPVILDEHGVEVEFLKESMAALGENVSFKEHFQVFLLELLGVKLASYVFACSEVDAKKIQAIYRVAENKIAVIPNGVSDDFFKKVQSYNYGKPSVLFVGSFDHTPNVFATKFLLKSVIPKLFDEHREVIFVFVGRNPPSWLCHHNFGERVKVIGNVKDVRPFIAGADVIVAPIFHGSGTRIKILQSMALNKPVISTSKGIEGLEVENGQNILITDTSEGFVESILSLLKDKSFAQEIGLNAKNFVEEKYVWKRIALNAFKIFRKLLT